MIVTKRESMASLIHDTSPILRHSLQQSHNKGLYYGFRDVTDKFGSTVMHAIMIPYDMIHICMHRSS